MGMSGKFKYQMLLFLFLFFLQFIGDPVPTTRKPFEPDAADAKCKHFFFYRKLIEYLTEQDTTHI